MKFSSRALRSTGNAGTGANITEETMPLVQIAEKQGFQKGTLSR